MLTALDRPQMPLAFPGWTGYTIIGFAGHQSDWIFLEGRPKWGEYRGIMDAFHAMLYGLDER